MRSAYFKPYNSSSTFAIGCSDARSWPCFRLLMISRLHREITVEPLFKICAQDNSSGVYICKSVVNDLRHGNFTCKSEGNYLTYEHRIEIPVEFTYVNQ